MADLSATRAEQPAGAGLRRLRRALASTMFTALATGLLYGCSAEQPEYRLPEFQRFMNGYSEKVGGATLPSSPVSTPADAATEPATRPSAITLAGAIEETLEQNLAIKSSAEDVAQARADVWTASVFPNPTITLDTVLQTFNRSALSPSNPSGPPQYDAILTYPVDWLLFGKREAAIEVAKQAANAAGATRADQIRQQVSATISSFYDVLQAKSTLSLDEEDLRQNEKLLEITTARVRAGGVGNVELDRVRVQLITARQTVDQDERALVAAKSALRVHLGRSQPDQSFDVIGTLEIPSQIPELNLGELMRRADENRPDLLALRYKLAQARADVQNQERQAAPQIAISGGYTFQEQVPIGQRNTSEFNAAIQSTIPIFDRNQGNIRKAKSAALQAMINYDAGVIQASSDIEQALDAFNAAHHILRENGAMLIESARNARDKLQKGYELGGYALVDVLSAQADYRNALRQDLALRLSYWRSLHNLNTAVGTQVLP
ncbi:MAG TPA: TolC family protein [Tepidisphaeraceae bacterium]|nr:TolC family protein [Tepidisphaeraceae bacterium]